MLRFPRELFKTIPKSYLTRLNWYQAFYRQTTVQLLQSCTTRGNRLFKCKLTSVATVGELESAHPTSHELTRDMPWTSFIDFLTQKINIFWVHLSDIWVKFRLKFRFTMNWHALIWNDMTFKGWKLPTCWCFKYYSTF